MEYRLPFRQYNKALRKNKLLGLKCNDCGKITCPPTMACSKCAGTNMEVCELSGNGLIVTLSTVYVAARGREAELPYTVALVELEEGPWIMGNLIDIDPRKAGMDLMGKKTALSFKVCPADEFSAGVAAARPAFCVMRE